jgi:hypothetical protein
MIIVWEFISGAMFGIEFITGGMVLDLGIVRIMFLKPDSPYIQYEE